jgi:tetratricopeptide (TPR) repeat protein
MDATELRQRLGAALRCLEAGHWRRAETECRGVLAAHPGDTQALLLLGLAVAAMGEPARAAPALDRVMQERPDYAHPCENLATLQPPLPRSLIAAQYRACLRLAPDNASLRRGFAAFLLENDAAAEAAAVLQDALCTASAHNLMGMALADLGRFTDAISQFEHAVALDPKPAPGWANLGLVLKVERRFEAALAAYDQAIARAPEDAQIRVNRAVALLQAGRWTEAWKDYEWRLHLAGGSGLPLDRLLPALSDLGDLHGLTVLATHEEGFGDTIHFARYLPLLARRGARVVAMVPRPLERLMRAVEGIDSVLTTDDALPSYDYHCPFFSLPRAFGTTVATIPNSIYLTADPALVTQWGRDLPTGGLRVGLVWAGQARPWLPGFTTLDQRRSAGLKALAPLARVHGVRFISLQLGPAAEELRHPPTGMTIDNPMAGVSDFADTAAIIANLDLVISVDTAVIHLAGGMGKPVFLLDRYDNCWRWLSGRSDSPWYPNLTIFRQERPGRWSEAVDRAATALDVLVAFRGPPVAASRPSRVPVLEDVA